MFTVEVGLRNSNPIDPALTVYRIQKQWSRNPETVISEFRAGCGRGCVRVRPLVPVGVAASGPARPKVVQSAGRAGLRGRSRRPGRREPAIRFGGESGRSKAVHDGSPEDFVPARRVQPLTN